LNEKRKHQRVKESAVISVKVLSAPDIPALEGKSFSCRTTDVAIEGLSLLTDIRVPVGAYLELDIILSGDSQQYRHTGNVIWSNVVASTNNDARAEQYHSGIKLNIESNSQQDCWCKAINRLLMEYGLPE
jgi:hypothetical protein